MSCCCGLCVSPLSPSPVSFLKWEQIPEIRFKRINPVGSHPHPILQDPGSLIHLLGSKDDGGK